MLHVFIGQRFIDIGKLRRGSFELLAPVINSLGFGHGSILQSFLARVKETHRKKITSGNIDAKASYLATRIIAYLYRMIDVREIRLVGQRARSPIVLVLP